MANEKGVWRTIGGRRVFIKEGQDLASAMKESGKFKTSKKTEDKKDHTFNMSNEDKEKYEKVGKKIDDLTKEIEDKDKVLEDFKNSDGSKENFEKALNKISEIEYNNEINPDEYKDYISKIQKEYVEKNKKTNNDYKSERMKGDLNKKGTFENFEIPGQNIKGMYNKETGEVMYTTGTNSANRNEYRVNINDLKDEDFPHTHEGFVKNYLTKEKSSNDIMNEKIRSKGKTKVEDDLPKRTEIKTQGTSNRKEVSDNIQAHILDYYTEDYTGENISPSEAFVRQMDAMGESNMWRAGQKIAEGGSYLIYNGDMADFLDELKINPKGKTFSEDKAFDMYTSLIGRESAKLYDRIQKNSYKKYMKAHPLSKMSFEEFKDMNKK